MGSRRSKSPRAALAKVATAVAVLAPALAIAQLPCVPADRDDGQPWVHAARVLDSFAKVAPAPTQIGSFLDAGRMYELSLWRDQQGYFGVLASPVLEADSPSSPLREIRWAPETRALQFVATPGGQEVRMLGVLAEEEFVVTRLSGKDVHGLVLVKEPEQPPLAWRSRAQFECAMKMWHRD